jgi:hypothetical protein
VILIDEYDMPINSAYTHDYYDELVGFLRNLLSGAFKDSLSVFRSDTNHPINGTKCPSLIVLNQQ